MLDLTFFFTLTMMPVLALLATSILVSLFEKEST